jgi:hypothetical protein
VTATPSTIVSTRTICSWSLPPSTTARSRQPCDGRCTADQQGSPHSGRWRFRIDRHHWLDATHISFGVLTGGVYSARWKAEASMFNGREPDENRLDLDVAPLDSVSGRVSFAPSPNLALQVSAGHLTRAEAQHAGGPAHDVVRVTASGTYHRRVNDRGLWATTVAWGTNSELAESSHAVVLESAVSTDGAHTWFGRLEVTGKPAHDLHIHESTRVFTVGKVQGGYVRYLSARHGVRPGVGGTLSASVLPSALQPRYGGAVAPGFGVFLTVRSASP